VRVAGALVIALVASLVAGWVTGTAVVRASGSLGTGYIVMMSLVVLILASWTALGAARIVGRSVEWLDRTAIAALALGYGLLLGFFGWTALQENAMPLRLRDHVGLSGAFAGVLAGIAVQWCLLRRSLPHVSAA
jgi:hypothetical protein